LAPPPIKSRSRSLAENEGRQMLGKEMVQAVRHPRHGHKPICRRTKKCAGGKDACSLAAFELIDVLMQPYVLPAIKRGYEAAKAAQKL